MNIENSKHQRPNNKQCPTRGASACAARDLNSKFQTPDRSEIATKGIVTRRFRFANS
jgi:hypothetical protein